MVNTVNILRGLGLEHYIKVKAVCTYRLMHTAFDPVVIIFLVL